MGKGGRATGVYKADSGTVSTVIETQSACRDRLLCALRHEQPDRLPVDFGGTSVTGECERLSGALDHSFARCWPFPGSARRRSERFMKASADKENPSVGVRQAEPRT